MNWKAHLLIGMFICFAFVAIMNAMLGWYPISDPFIFTSILFLSFISPLVPDLDHSKGKLREWLIDIGIVITIVAGILWYIAFKYDFGIEIFRIITLISIGFVLFIFLISIFAQHRGFLHSIVFCIIYGGSISLLNWQLGILAALGCFIHNLLDGSLKLK